ncbi:EpsG family protein [Clostridium celatum]|uniref:EpsG family protein n=1 Tax=Clostridium celatum TaxID=36834 RepID=UPI0028FFC938|nr:EpsG family protein [Clostridium celatum]MDU2265562.1 EpsG family protein [Clostridium celatum]MDU6295418.1 EpsG family protein [Clostridium celatum]
MGVFYGELALVYFFSLVSRICNYKKQRIMAILFGILTVIVLVVVAGLSRGIGDSGMYKHSYNILVQNPSSATFDRDGGWTLYNLILTFISSNPQTLLIITALITHLLNFIILYKYQSYLELQVYLYIASGYYLVTMNGMRQCLAAALIFICTKYLIQGKFKKYLVSILLISSIHGSALIMIPIYFIVRQEAWSKRIMKLLILAVIGVISYGYLEPIFFKLLENTQYGHYSEFKEGGSSLMRTIVNLVPTILAYLKRDKLKEVWAEGNIFINMSIINSIFVAFGMYNWIFNRFTLYFQLYNFILLPYIIKSCFKGKEKRLLYIGLLICYFIFLYREQVIGLNIQYRSDYLDFNKLFYTTN